MAINWAEVQKELVPIKDYEDCCRRLSASLAYPFVTNLYNLSMPALADYTQKILGGDRASPLHGVSLPIDWHNLRAARCRPGGCAAPDPAHRYPG